MTTDKITKHFLSAFSMKMIANIVVFALIFGEFGAVFGQTSECLQWQSMCATARDHSEPRFACRERSVFYFSSEPQSWERSRQLCASKFFASNTADLFEMTADKMSRVNQTLHALLSHESAKQLELFTNGICCRRKVVNRTENFCEWITSSVQIPTDQFPEPLMRDKCQILSVHVSLSQSSLVYTHSYNEKTDSTVLPSLCVYEAPVDCDVTPTTTTTVTTTPTRPPSPPTTALTASSASGSASPSTGSPAVSTSTERQTDAKTVCNHDHAYDGQYGIAIWTPVAPNEWSNNTCPSPPYAPASGSARWLCSSGARFDARGPLIDCRQQWLDEQWARVQNITRVEQVLNETDFLSQKLSAAPSGAPALQYFGDLSAVLDIVDALRVAFDALAANDDHTRATTFTTQVLDVCSQLLDRKWTAVWANCRADQRTQLSAAILSSIQHSGFSLACRRHASSPDTWPVIRAPNIALNTFAMDGTRVTFSYNGSSVSVAHNGSVVNEHCSGRAVGVAFGGAIAAYLSADTRVNSDLMAFSFTNDTHSEPLSRSHSVTVELEHEETLEFGDRVRCLWWDFAASLWSSDGCRLVRDQSSRTRTVCSCSHLTNFAALMDVSGRETRSTVKSVLTIVCCALSIVGLALTAGLLTLVRALRSRRSTITVNLCASLLVTNVLVVFGLDRTGNAALCSSVSGLLLYWLLASFSWMLMEGYHLYQMIILVFSNIGHLKLVWLYAIGYGAPALVFLVSCLAIGFNELRGEYFCWISSSRFPFRVWAVAGPATTVTLANCLVMFLALRAAMTAKTNKQSDKPEISSVSDSASSGTAAARPAVNVWARVSWLKGYASLVALLGLTWLTYLLYVHEFGTVFSYVFIVLNGLQGVFIFVFQVLFNEKVRSIIAKEVHKRRRHLSRANNSSFFSSLRATIRSKSMSSTVVEHSVRHKSIVSENILT